MRGSLCSDILMDLLRIVSNFQYADLKYVICIFSDIEFYALYKLYEGSVCILARIIKCV